MTRAVVTGASGLLGSAVLRDLARHGGRVEGWSGSTPSLPDGTALRPLPLEEAGVAERALRAAGPELVVHCAALTDVDACERDPAAAEALNADVPGRLAATARALGARFVHVSTDAVYDGERPGPHAEDEPPAPVNAYARSKLAGEEAVLAAHPGAVVVRTTMHGWTAAGRPSFSEAILRGLLRGDALRLFDDVRFAPLVSTALAAVLRRLAAAGARGVLNAGASDTVTKHRFGCMVASAFGLPDDAIEPVALAERGLLAPRPRDLGLCVDALAARLGSRPPTVAEGIDELRRAVHDGSAARAKGRAPEAGLAGLVAA